MAGSAYAARLAEMVRADGRAGLAGLPAPHAAGRGPGHRRDRPAAGPGAVGGAGPGAARRPGPGPGRAPDGPGAPRGPGRPAVDAEGGGVGGGRLAPGGLALAGVRQRLDGADRGDARWRVRGRGEGRMTGRRETLTAKLIECAEANMDGYVEGRSHWTDLLREAAAALRDEGAEPPVATTAVEAIRAFLPKITSGYYGHHKSLANVRTSLEKLLPTPEAAPRLPQEDYAKRVRASAHPITASLRRADGRESPLPASEGETAAPPQEPTPCKHRWQRESPEFAFHCVWCGVQSSADIQALLEDVDRPAAPLGVGEVVTRLRSVLQKYLNKSGSPICTNYEQDNRYDVPGWCVHCNQRDFLHDLAAMPPRRWDGPHDGDPVLCGMTEAPHHSYPCELPQGHDGSHAANLDLVDEQGPIPPTRWDDPAAPVPSGGPETPRPCDQKHGGTPCSDSHCHVRFIDEEGPAETPRQGEPR